MTDWAGSLSYSANYDPYGALIEAQGLSASFGFTGEMTDDTGLQYLRARYMDISTGTFLTKDPIMGQVGGASVRWNPYLYAGGNPVNYVDPDGKFFFFALAVIAGAALVIGAVGAGTWELMVEQGRGVGGAHQFDPACDIDWQKVANAALAGLLGTGLGLADAIPGLGFARMMAAAAGTPFQDQNRNFFGNLGLGQQYDALSKDNYFQVGQVIGGVGALGINLASLVNMPALFSSVGTTGVSFGNGIMAFVQGQQIVLNGVAALQVGYAVTAGAAAGATVGQVVMMAGNGGGDNNSAYLSYDDDGNVQYVGITNDVARRQAQHFASTGIEIEPLLENLSRADARAVEQALIEIHGLGKTGGALLNKINSISQSNPNYASQLQRGYDLLVSIGYSG